jgi:hypothetical protein
MKEQKKHFLLICIGAALGVLITALAIWLWIALTQMVSVVYVTSTIIVLIAICVIIILLNRRRRETLKKSFETDLNKYKLYCNLFTSWIVYKNKGKTVAEYFKDRNYKSIAIYGLGRLGICLYGELQTCDIDVKYAIDSNAEHFSYLDIPVIPLTGNFEIVDAIVVANIEQFDKISAGLHKKGSFNVISLEDIIGSI